MLKSIKRLYEIFRVLLYYRLDQYIPRVGALRWVRWIVYLHPAYYRRKADIELTAGERLRLALESLGPIFVKLGQTLSTRPDLIPEEVSVELCKLQDRVPPFDGKVAREIIERALKRPIEAIFSTFDDTALASASVAQVHCAVLHNQEAVVVKVLRPDVEKNIQRDVLLMYVLARLACSTKEGRRLRLVEVVRELEFTLHNEVDLLNEAASASQVGVNFANSNILHVPKVYWSYCCRQVMVQERIFYPNIFDPTVLMQVNKKVLAERGVKIFFTQVFRDSFFHADMHAGNIFVDISDPQDPKYCAVDFGIMGALTSEDKHYLAENFLAFFNRDYRRVAELHIESGWVPANTRVTDFESAIRKVSEPIFGRPIKDISFGAFLFSLFQTARRFDMQIQPQLVLLQKTFFNVEGLGRQLYPELDLWSTAKPVLEDWMKRQIGPRALIKRLRSYAHEYTLVLPKLPIAAYQLVNKTLQSYEEEKKRVHFSGYRLASILTGAAMLMGTLILWIVGHPSGVAQNFALIVSVITSFWLLYRS